MEHLDKLLNGIILKLALAEVGLLNEEFDVCLLFLLVDTLIGIGCNSCLGSEHGALVEFGSGDNAIGYLYLWHSYFFISQTGLEGKIHVGLILAYIGEIGFHGIVTTHFVRNGLVVTQYILTLESSSITLHNSAIGIAKFWYNGHNGLLLHILFGEVTIDGCGHCSCLSFEGVRNNIEIVC